MKQIKKILYAILGLLSLLSLFIIVCAFQPSLADRVSDLLYGTAMNRNVQPEGTVAVSTGAEGNGETNAVSVASGIAADENGRNGTGSAGTGTGNGSSGAGTGNGSVGAGSGSAGTGAGALGTTDAGLRPDGQSGYVPPERTTVNVPEEVTGRGGYVPVEEDTRQVDEEEAGQLREQYTYGETGDGLTFDPVYYPYYGMLEDKTQHLYRQIYANAMAVNGIFNPVEQVTADQLKNVFQAVTNDHPELFWLDSAYGGRMDGTGTCVQLSLRFNELTDRLDAAKAEFHAAAEEILAEAEKLENDYEKELAVHDALLDRIEYDLQAPLNQSAYSALAGGRTVCAGYARAFQYLMTQLGVPCYYCTGYAGQNHAWNIIRLDGEYYNADTTWDDTDPGTYDYFNRTDSEFASTHVREDLSVYLPACNGQKYGNRETGLQTDTGEPVYAENGRTLEASGFSEEAVLKNPEAYYDDCYNQIMANNGSGQFENVVDNRDIWFTCYDSYVNDSYLDAYMNQAAAELGCSGCKVDIEAEELADGRVLLKHNISFY